MKLSDFDYDLPEDLIAQFAVEPRDSSRLMVLDRGEESIHHAHFRDLPGFLRPGDCLVVNETRVFPARLKGVRKGTGGAIELLLVRQDGDLWEVMARPGRRMRPGVEFIFPGEDLTAVVEEVLPSGRRMVRFRGGASLDEVLDRCGHVPLPPYIKRDDVPEDRERYQAVYAKTSGAVAAPTAGLHFTPELLAAVREKGVTVTPVLLHVGPGTFKPVEVDDPAQHQMDAEYYEVTPEATDVVNGCRRNGGRVVAVGTTSVRVLESCAEEADGVWRLAPGSGWTDLFIFPPRDFRVVDALITNFHLPKSTLLMMVSALAGREFVMRAYSEATRERYRFYSYGDAMLLQ